MRRFLQLFIACCLFSTNVIAQDCISADSVVLNRHYPFGDSYWLWFKGDQSLTYLIEVGPDGFTPQASEEDTTYQALDWTSNDSLLYHPSLGPFSYDNGSELYVYPICTGGILGDYIGPFDLDYPEPPLPCGNSPDNPCDLEIDYQDTLIYYIPTEQFTTMSSPYTQSCGWESGAWASFIAPMSGTIRVNSTHGMSHLSIYDQSTQEIFCDEAECIPGDIPHLVDTTITALLSGSEYLVFASEGAVWDANCLSPLISGFPLPISLTAVADTFEVTTSAPLFDTICWATEEHDPQFTITGGCPPYQVDFEDVVFNYACPGPILRTYSLSDSCGNNAGPFEFWLSCELSELCPTIDLIGGVDTLSLSCGDSIPLIEPSFSSPCGLNWPISYVDSLLSDPGFCPATWLRTFTVTDNCADEGVFDQIIQISDSIPPMLSCPEVDSMLTDIGGAPYNFIASNFEVEDCSYVEPLMSDFDELQFLEIGTHWDVIWAVDACGNVSSCTYPIVVYSTVGLSEVGIPGLEFTALQNRIQLNCETICELDWSILDMMGREVKSGRMTEGLSEIALTDLPTASFLLQVMDQKERRSVFRFSKVE